MKQRSLAVAVLAALAFPAHAATFYVRPDGNSACTGRVDAAWSSGVTACAKATPNQGVSAMSGGDTLIIANGSYGLTGELDIKTGTQASPTRIRGEQAGNCKVKPELWASVYIARMVDLGAGDWIEVECLEITDRNGCVYRHPSFPCSGAWGLHGIYAKGASNLTVRDVNVHGLGNGFKGGAVENSTWERVRLWANAEAGFHGATGCSAAQCDSFSGVHTFRQVEIAWNGCGEDYPSLAIIGCHGDYDLDGDGDRDGYGDGFGTAETGGTWIWEDSQVHHNTSDGLDLRYTKLPDADVTVRRSWFFGNAGNPLKVWGKALIENNVILANCGYFGTRYGTGADTGNGNAIKTDPEPCRADGNAFIVIPGNCTGVCAVLRHNTIAGESEALLQFASGGTGTGYLARLENNVIIGAPAYKSGLNPKFISNGAGIGYSLHNNRVFGARDVSCSASECVVADPQLRNRGMTGFDPRPAVGSPLIGAGTTSCGETPCVKPADDLRKRQRPANAAIGAIEP